MLRKIICLLLLVSFFVVGCGKESESKIVKKLNDNIKKTKSYYIEGDLSVLNSTNEYKYDVSVYYLEKDYYRVNLLNKENNHEQIILKNKDGVYVITPSLNKSFKFQSNWPNDSSQVYLIDSLYDDIFNSKDRVFNNTNDNYIFEIKANYPNNSNLVKQSITFDKDLVLKNVKVFNDNNEVQMNMEFSNIVFNEKVDKNMFNMDNIIEGLNEKEKQEEVINSIEDIIYPLYIPLGTVLTEEEKVNKGDGERIILTFEGEKPFILVEETVSIDNEFTIVPMQGEPELLYDTIASISNNSISWISNGIEYYLVSDVMSQIELLEIAASVTKIEVEK